MFLLPETMEQWNIRLYRGVVVNPPPPLGREKGLFPSAISKIPNAFSYQLLIPTTFFHGMLFPSTRNLIPSSGILIPTKFAKMCKKCANLQNFAKYLQKMCKFAKHLQNFAKYFAKNVQICKIFAKICKKCAIFGKNLGLQIISSSNGYLEVESSPQAENFGISDLLNRDF